MPIHNLGYRSWTGEFEPAGTRWTVIAEIGIRRAWLSSWLRRVLFFAWVPGVLMGFMIFMYEQSNADVRSFSRGAFGGLAQLLLEPQVSSGFPRHVNVMQLLTNKDEDPGKQRHAFWSLLLQTLFKRSQPFILIPLIGLIAPPLISQDFRSRAFLLYFSRPINRSQYIIGKVATVLFYLIMITLLPALLLFVTGVALSPGLQVLNATWDLPFRSLACTCVIVLPSTALALMLSSLTTESRYASFGWFAIWIFGFLAHLAVTPIIATDSHSLLHCLSLFHVYSDVTAWILDPSFKITGIETRIILLMVLTAVSTAVVFRRVSAPMQI
ncbi:MAG: ABC transporter permease subunit [Planctomycetaceae bacterium]|nr:ABC transporter permease subunit [Planctomycetaceae bacterium]